MSVNQDFPIRKVRKRDGELVPFCAELILTAITNALHATAEADVAAAAQVAEKVYAELRQIAATHANYIPNVEGVQDLVEKALILSDYLDTAQAYVVYRANRAESRAKSSKISAELRELAHTSASYFRNPLSEFIYLRTYARWMPEQQRRETWVETVDRYMVFMQSRLPTQLTSAEIAGLRAAILTQEVMPSMRLMQFAGEACASNCVYAYNCAYIAPRCWRDFVEVMFVLMCGVGVGFSVEHSCVSALPAIQTQSGTTLPPHRVNDNKTGWCDALLLGLQTWSSGADVTFDLRDLRPMGARLHTSGGRSGGPQPLRTLLDYVRQLMLSNQGRQLTTLQVYDLLCKIGEQVVIGGIRRSAMLSLSDVDDVALRDAKRGKFYSSEPQRAIANNSAVYNTRPTQEQFAREWQALRTSGTGERGIFNRGSLIKHMPPRRLQAWRAQGVTENEQLQGFLGTNPCGEIILQSKQFCNLTEVIARPHDTLESLQRKVRFAALLGTYQATLTEFPYLSQQWQQNCEAERLLGVSLTGMWDCEPCRDPKVLAQLQTLAIAVNAEYAQRFNINPATSVTCIKPSGTVSQMVDCAAGMHPRFARYYLRRVRIASTDALLQLLQSQGIPCGPDVGQAGGQATTFVVEFPVQAPEGAILSESLDALQQLQFFKLVKTSYTEHNSSITIYVAESEWQQVEQWVYANWDVVGGITFLPRSSSAYELPPFEAIAKDEFERRQALFANLDFAELAAFEMADSTDPKFGSGCDSDSCSED